MYMEPALYKMLNRTNAFKVQREKEVLTTSYLPS